MRIKAMKQFSHYHLGTVDRDEERNVPEDAGTALVGMGLADEVLPARRDEEQREPAPTAAAPGMKRKPASK